ncbi:MAG: hypothetical protein L0209_05455 [candidate division Zixibacteria bacterium]|nr:hypothetical protein [candidate division Zixibacteria bacterium]
MLRRWLLPFVFLACFSAADAKDRAVEISVGGGIYFSTHDDYDLYFDGQPTSFSLQASFLGSSSLTFKLRGDYITKQIDRAPFYRGAAARLYDLRIGFDWRLFRDRQFFPFVGAGFGVGEARVSSSLNAKFYGGYIEGGIRYRIARPLFVGAEAWQDFRQGEDLGVGNINLGGTHIGLRAGVRLGK